MVSTAVVVVDSATWLTTTTHFGHESVKLTLRSISDTALVAIPARTAVVAPGLTDLAIGTVTSHMSSLATNTTDDVARDVHPLWTVVLAMTNLAAVLACLVLVISKSSVKGGELTELVALEFVLAFGDRGSLDSQYGHNKRVDLETYRLNHIVNKLLRLVDLVLGVGHDQTVEIFFLVAGVSGVRSSFTLFDGAFAADRNLCARFGFHFLQRVSTRANKQTNC
jgi:hypothetical protein